MWSVGKAEMGDPNFQFAFLHRFGVVSPYFDPTSCIHPTSEQPHGLSDHISSTRKIPSRIKCSGSTDDSRTMERERSCFHDRKYDFLIPYEMIDSPNRTMISDTESRSTVSEDVDNANRTM